MAFGSPLQAGRVSPACEGGDRKGASMTETIPPLCYPPLTPSGLKEPLAIGGVSELPCDAPGQPETLHVRGSRGGE